MGSERVALWRTPRYWVIFACVIVGATAIAYTIAVWASESDGSASVTQQGSGAGGSRDLQRPLPGPTVHDTMSKKKELERN